MSVSITKVTNNVRFDECYNGRPDDLFIGGAYHVLFEVDSIHDFYGNKDKQLNDIIKKLKEMNVSFSLSPVLEHEVYGDRLGACSYYVFIMNSGESTLVKLVFKDAIIRFYRY